MYVTAVPMYVTAVLCTYCRSRHLLTFSAPAIPLLPDPPLPGPGHYELMDYKDPESSGAVFVSTTGRWNKLTAAQHDLPGPGTLVYLHRTSWVVRPPSHSSICMPAY